MKSYAEFKNDLGARESSNRYDCVNAWGFLGRFQFGKPRLMDLGLIDPTTKMWRFGLTDELFLQSPQLQDATFDVHVAKLAGMIRVRYMGKMSQYVTVSGCVAVAHLLGMGGLAKWLKGEDGADALGTKASDYASLFKGYDIPMGLPRFIPSQIIWDVIKRSAIE